MVDLGFGDTRLVGNQSRCDTKLVGNALVDPEFGDNAACRNQSRCDTKLVGKTLVDPEFGDTRLVGTSHVVTQTRRKGFGGPRIRRYTACRNQSRCDTKLVGKAMVDPEFGDTRLVRTSHAVTQNSSERLWWIQNSEIHGLSEPVTL